MTDTTTTQSDLFAAATQAALNFKSVKAGNKEAAEAAFRASATATYMALTGKSAKSANKLAEANKAAGAGYGSAAAVGFHSLTGRALTHLSAPVDDDGNEIAFSAQRIQTLIKKVGQEKAKAIITKASDLGDFATRLGEAYEAPAVDMSKALEQALDLVSKVEEQRLLGHALPTGADTFVAALRTALDNVVLGNTPTQSEVVGQVSDEVLALVSNS
jgi:hypothetical protein